MRNRFWRASDFPTGRSLSSEIKSKCVLPSGSFSRLRLPIRCSCPQYSPSIGADGTVYVGGYDDDLYAVPGTTTLANSAWPKYRHDLLNTGLYY